MPRRQRNTHLDQSTASNGPTIKHPPAHNSRRGASKQRSAKHRDGVRLRRAVLSGIPGAGNQCIHSYVTGQSYKVCPVSLAVVPASCTFAIPTKNVQDVRTAHDENGYIAGLVNHSLLIDSFLSPVAAIIAIKRNCQLTDDEKAYLVGNVVAYYQCNSWHIDKAVPAAITAVNNQDLAALQLACKPTEQDLSYVRGTVVFTSTGVGKKSSKRSESKAAPDAAATEQRDELRAPVSPGRISVDILDVFDAADNALAVNDK
jgi:hypothetical protein